MPTRAARAHMSALGQNRAAEVARPQHRLPRETILAEQVQTLVGVAQLGMQLDDGGANVPETLGIAAQEEELRALDVAFQQIDCLNVAKV
jgi:hypothetical protein